MCYQKPYDVIAMNTEELQDELDRYLRLSKKYSKRVHGKKRMREIIECIYELREWIGVKQNED